MLCLVVSKTQINSRLSRNSRRKSPSLWLNFPFKFSALCFFEYHFQRRPGGFAYHILQHLQHLSFFFPFLFFSQILIPLFLALVVKTSLRWTSRINIPSGHIWITSRVHLPNTEWPCKLVLASVLPPSSLDCHTGREVGLRTWLGGLDSFSGSAGHIPNKDRNASRGRSSTVGREVTFQIQTVTLLPGSFTLCGSLHFSTS